MIRNPRSHRGRDSQRLVNAAKIVKREPAGYSGPVILPLLAEGVRQPCEAAKAHARAQLLRSTIEVQIRSGSGWPYTGTSSTKASAGE